MAYGPSIEFGDFAVDRADERILGPNGPVHVGNKAYCVLNALIDADGRLLTKDALLETVWDGTFVSESALTSVIKELRRALGDDIRAPRYIASVYGRGYRLVAPTRRSDPGGILTTVDDGRAALAVAAPLALPDKPSVAVVPFASLARDEDYFADGMAVEIVSALSRFRSLFVISSGSMLSYRGDPRRPAEMARELGVRYILQGTVRKAGNHVRIGVELLDEAARSPLWAETFDGELDDIFVLQDRVSLAIASQIEPSITASEVRRAAQQPPSNTAYDLYLRGTQAYWELWTQDSLSRAARLFEQSAAIDPDFALAHAYASSALINCVLQGHAEDPAPVMAESARYAHAALRAGQDDAEVLALAAYTLFQCQEPQTNIDALMTRALAINPGMSRCHYTAGFVNLYACRSQDALDAYDMALRLDPRTPWRDAIMIGRAQALVQLERYEEALPLYAHAEIVFPEVAVAIRRIAALCRARLGDLAAARAIPGVTGPVTPNEHFLISRYRDPAFRQKLYDGIALLQEG